jgi:hypothetical protein
MKWWKTIKTIVTLALVAGFAAAAYFLWQSQGRPRTVKIVDAPAVLREIQALKELVTVKYSIQKIIGLREDKVPFGREQLVLIVQARVLGGIDLGELKTDDIQIADKTVTIRLPEPKILHIYIDEKETREWQREKTWFVRYDLTLNQKARQAALESVRAAALDMGILADARKNSEAAIAELLKNLGFERVEFAAAAEKSP